MCFSLALKELVGAVHVDSQPESEQSVEGGRGHEKRAEQREERAAGGS